MASALKYFAFYKPFQVLSCFKTSDGKKTLADFDFPPEVYPIGRLDFDSEGLIVLTNDNFLATQLLNPFYKHNRTYFVQVENIPNISQLNTLANGVDINLSGKVYHTAKCNAELINFTPNLPERVPNIRFRKNIPTQWISITLNEGKNRQIRKMTAKIGFPTLRLVRFSIENLSIEGYDSGEIRSFNKDEIYSKLLISR